MHANKILINEFLDEIRDRANRNHNGYLHRAFLDWYVEAEFGNCQWVFTDGAGDNGIDALVWRPTERPTAIIIQSKFTESVGKFLLSRTAYKEFGEVLDAYYCGGEIFDQWLSHATLGLPYHYRKAQQFLVGCGNWAQRKKAFRLVTTCSRRSQEEDGRIPEGNYVYADDIISLYQRYRRNMTPQAKDLALSAKKLITYRDGNRRVSSFLFNTKVSDFRRYLKENDVARLVARNIRYELPGKIGRQIRKTYDERPHDFWYLHNGLTVICDELKRSYRKVVLIHPNIINGAQTLYALSHCKETRSSAEVCIRAIVRGSESDASPEDDDWLQSIIRGVNTQHRVRAFDLCSNEPEQVLLQQRFRDVKVFYERKRGEWRGSRHDPRFKSFACLSLPSLGKVLTAVHSRDGSGPLLVKRGVDELFEDRNYLKLFPSKSTVGYRFPKIYFAYRLHELLYDFGYDTRKRQRIQRHAFWHAVWLAYQLSGINNGLIEGLSVMQLKQAFDYCRLRTRIGRQARKTMKVTTKATWKIWREARKRDQESLTPVNFFKTKEASRLVLRRGAPSCRLELERFFREFAQLARGK